MKYRKIHYHLDYIERYNRVLAGLEPKPGNLSLEGVKKAKNAHEAKAAALLHDGIKKGDGDRGGYERTEKHKNGWYEKVTAAKNAKRIAAGLEPYRDIGKAKNPKKRGKV